MNAVDASTPQQRLEDELSSTAQVIVKLTKKLVANRRERVRLLARATREALDTLPPEARGPGYRTRTWDLPELGAASKKIFDEISQKLAHFVSHASVRLMVFSRATQLAIDDLSPEEGQTALAEATQIIGTPP